MEKEDEANQFAKRIIATITGILLLIGAVYGTYRYSQNRSGTLILPGGVTYLGPSPSPQTAQPSPLPLHFTLESDVTWNTYSGKLYPYTFSYPSSLPIVIFPEDTNDSVAISWGNVAAQENILLNMEFIDKRDPQLTKKPKSEYVRNWYTFFPGWKDVASVTPFTNTNGLKGYKAVYINTRGASPNLDVFFEIPQDPNMLIHLANGILDPDIFDRIIDSVKWTPKK